MSNPLFALPPEQLELPGMEPAAAPAATNVSPEQLEAWYNVAMQNGAMGTLTVPMMHEAELVSYIGHLIELVGIQEAACEALQSAPPAPVTVREAGDIHPTLIALREVLNYIPDDKLARAVELFNKAQEQL